MQAEAWMPVLLGAKPGGTAPSRQGALDSSRCFNWTLSPLLALENLDLEGWLWFLRAVTHAPEKVSATIAGSGHKRAVKTCSYAATWSWGGKLGDKCFKGEGRVRIREEKQHSDGVKGSKLV